MGCTVYQGGLNMHIKGMNFQSSTEEVSCFGLGGAWRKHYLYFRGFLTAVSIRN